MSPHEQALADKSPTFADLCDQMRQAKRNHMRAVSALETAKLAVARASEAADKALAETDEAEDRLHEFIARETDVEDSA
jgi:hypothetical protein